MSSSIYRDQINVRQVNSHTYHADAHEDWAIGPILLGSSVAGVLHAVASTHLSTTLAATKQPDIHTLHVEFLRPCVEDDIVVKITDLKTGKGTNFLQLNLSQDEEEKVIALITSTNFAVELGPTKKTDWTLYPAPKPLPDFGKIAARQPEPNWIPLKVFGEIVPMSKRLTSLHPRGGYPVDGCTDIWHTFDAPERITADYLPLLVELMASPTDTLLHSGGEYDARDKYARNAEWAEKNPGIPAQFTHKLADVMKKSVFESTLTMDIEFKRRIPEEGLGWVFTRQIVKMLKKGRMDFECIICDDNMQPVIFARQVSLSHDTHRRFRAENKGKL